MQVDVQVLCVYFVYLLCGADIVPIDDFVSNAIIDTGWQPIDWSPASSIGCHPPWQPYFVSRETPMAQRKRYTDEQRAEAVLFLEAAGYPNTPGALAAAERATGIARQVLTGWATGEQNPPPPQVLQEKRGELTERLEGLLHLFIDEIIAKMPEARFGELTIGAGITADKLMNLSGNMPSTHHKIEFITSTIGPAAPLLLDSEQSTADEGEYRVMSS